MLGVYLHIIQGPGIKLPKRECIAARGPLWGVELEAGEAERTEHCAFASHEYRETGHHYLFTSRLA